MNPFPKLPKRSEEGINILEIRILWTYDRPRTHKFMAFNSYVYENINRSYLRTLYPLRSVIHMRICSLQQRIDMRHRPKIHPFIQQQWNDLIFLHWKFDPQEIQKKLPEGLFVDTYEGYGYVSLVAFFMDDVKLSRLSFLPGICDYIEVNVRTYVHDRDGNPGVWFFSLDLNSYFASKLARAMYSLPYIDTPLKGIKEGRRISIQGARTDSNVNMEFSYEPQTENYAPIADYGSLDFFLLERYALFTKRRGKLLIGRVYHEPYKVSQAHIIRYESNLLESHDFYGGTPIDRYHYSPGVSVDIYSLNKS